MGGLLKVAHTQTHSLPVFINRAGRELGYNMVDANGEKMLGQLVISLEFFIFFS
jgi:hypothetical protein